MDFRALQGHAVPLIPSKRPSNSCPQLSEPNEWHRVVNPKQICGKSLIISSRIDLKT